MDIDIHFIKEIKLSKDTLTITNTKVKQLEIIDKNDNRIKITLYADEWKNLKFERVKK